MKTQINNLVNGSKSVIGRVEEFKGGSNYNLREQIAIKVQEENKETMSIEIRGVALELNRSQSVSGKTIKFHSEINKDQYADILGFESDISNYEAFYSFVINDDMTCQIDIHARKTENHQWKHRGSIYIAESLIIIN